MQVAGKASHLALQASSQPGIAPDAVLGLCPVHMARPGSAQKRKSHYLCVSLDDGSSATWDQLLLDSHLEQYTNLCEHQTASYKLALKGFDACCDEPRFAAEAPVSCACHEVCMGLA